MAKQTVRITESLTVGRGDRLLLIAGPCQIESRDHCLKIATFLADLAKRLPVDVVFKSSFDKANRTSGKSKRGIGIDEGLNILCGVREATGLPTLTDLHDTEQVAAVAQAVDVIQTPAFLCRQTDLLVAVGKTGKAVNIKKGQFLHPHDMQHVAEKVASTGNHNIMLCERGSCFGYRDLVVDMRGFEIMRATGYPIIFDATHSVQSMGGAGGASGGERKYIAPLVRAAVGAGVDGLFIECHDNPAAAPSDGPSMLPLTEMESLISTACALHALVRAKVHS